MLLRLNAFLCATGLTILLAVSAYAGDYRIVPGQRIGAVALGMSRQTVHETLHAPSRVHCLRDQITEEDWVTPRKISQAATNQGIYWRDNFVTVYFRNDRVVQVEVNAQRFSTTDGLTTRNNPAAWGKRYKPFRSTYRMGASHDPGGYPGTKHFMAYYDAVQSGIAWREGRWGDLDPGPDPGDPPATNGTLEIVIVHVPGESMIIDPDGDARFVLTEAEAHGH